MECESCKGVTALWVGFTGQANSHNESGGVTILHQTGGTLEGGKPSGLTRYSN